MFSNGDEVLKFIKDEDVKFVDVRFCDLPGVMQHFNVPAASVDATFFAEGQMFDGSSIRGFQAINESDMKLIPDVTSAFVDGCGNVTRAAWSAWRGSTNSFARSGTRPSSQNRMNASSPCV